MLFGSNIATSLLISSTSYVDMIDDFRVKEYCEKPAHIQTLQKTLEGRRDAQRDIYDAKVERQIRLEKRTPAQKRAIAKRRAKKKA